MPIIIPAGFGQVIHQLRLDGDPEPMAVTYGVDIDTAGVTDPAVTADDLHERFFTALGSIAHSSYTLYSTELRWNSGAGVDLSVVLHVEPKVFTGTQAPLPQNCAGLIHKRSGSVGRRHRGRFYLPGFGEGDVTGVGGISSGTQGTVNTKLATWLTALQTLIPAIDGMVILHSTGITGAPPPTPVTSMILDPVIATQRRRLRR
jgi:hypothetical protein